MRIIGGQLRGKKLGPVRAAAVRPSSDRLREAVFSILSVSVKDAAVLDLFAGTGAFGIEALSRGARKAVFVDRNRDAIAMICKNIQVCRLESRATVIRWDVARNLDCLRTVNSPFELVFIDPPYDRGLILPTLAHLNQQRLLAAGGQVVVEHSPSEQISPEPEGFTTVDSRKYGKTLVSFLVAVV